MIILLCMRNFFYKNNDIIIVLLILVVAACLIYHRVTIILDYPEMAAQQNQTETVQETEAPDVTEPTE